MRRRSFSERELQEGEALFETVPMLRAPSLGLPETTSDECLDPFDMLNLGAGDMTQMPVQLEQSESKIDDRWFYQYMALSSSF